MSESIIMDIPSAQVVGQIPLSLDRKTMVFLIYLEILNNQRMACESPYEEAFNKYKKFEAKYQQEFEDGKSN